MKIKFEKIHLIQAVLLVLGIALGALMLNPLQIQVNRRAEIVKEDIISRLEDSLGVKISYERVSPALLSTVVIHDFNVIFEQGDFRAEVARIYYNPLRALTGGEPLQFISRVAVENGHLNLAVSSKSQRKEKAANRRINAAKTLFASKSVELSGLSAKIRFDDAIQLNVSNVNLASNDEGGIVRYEIAGKVHLRGMGSLNEIGEIRSEVVSEGSFSPTEPSVHGRLDILSAASQYVVLQPISVDFTYVNSRLAARRVGDNIPIDLSIDYSSDGWGISGETEKLDITNIAMPGTSSGWLKPYFSSIVDGRFQLSASPSFDDLHYAVDMDLQTDLEIEEGGYETELKFRGSRSSMHIDKLRVSSKWGGFSYAGIFDIERLAPDGFLAFSLNESLLGYPAFVKFNLNTRGGVITARAEELEANGIRFDDLRFLVIPEDGSFAASLIAIPEGPDNSQEKMLTVDLLVDSRTELAIHGFVNMKGFESSLITRLIGFRSQFNLPLDFLLDMNGSFEANSKTWSASLDEVALRHRHNQNNGLIISGRATPENWSLDRLRATWNEYVVDGRGYGERLAQGGFTEVRLLFGEQIFPLTAQWFEDGSLIVDSDFGLTAYMGARSTHERSIKFVGDSISIPLSDGRLVSSVDIRGQVAARGDWELYINRAQLLLAGRSQKSDTAVSFGGSFSRDSVIIPTISISDDYGELTGNAVFEAANNSQDMLGRLFLAGSDDERYLITLDKVGEIWNIGLDISAASIERMVSGRFSGELFVDGSLGGTLKNPSISLNLDSNGIADGRPFEVRGAISLESELMQIKDIEYSHNGISLSRGLVLLNMKEGSLKSTAEFNAAYNLVPVSSGFSLAVDFGRSLGIAELPYLFDSNYRGTIATQAVMWDLEPHLPAYTFHFSKDEDFFRIASPSSDFLNLTYSYENGELNVLSGSKMPVVSRGKGTIKDGNINFSFSELAIDPVLINYVMYRDPILLQYHVVFQSGNFVGELDIAGPLNNPEIDGILQAVDLKVDTPYTYAKIQPASTNIHFEGHRITIDRIYLSVGDGVLYGGGFVVLDRFEVVEFDMTYGATSTSRGAGVPVYYPLLGVNLDGVFTGEVHMTGGNNRFYLDGDFTFPKLRASLGNSIKPVSQIRESVYPSAVFLDFNFTTGNNCIFYLPNEELRIIRATVEAGETVNLVFSNDPYNLSLTGDLPIKTGDIFYFDRDFQITEGSLNFDETFRKFNPMLSFRAETRVKDERGEDVLIALVYNAPVLSDFNPTIETVSPRSDVLSLFGQAVAPYANSQDNRGTSKMLLATGGIFGQMGIVQPIEEALQEGLNLDMVSIQTDIVENALAEGLTRDANSGLSAKSQNLGRYLDNTSMYLGKYIGNSLFLSGTVSANYLENQKISHFFGELEFRASIDLEMTTPFFNVLWSYSPNPLSSEGFAVNNAITLKWRFSY